MADEAQIRNSLSIRVGNIDYRSNPTAFNATVVSVGGPTPGAIVVPVSGVDIDLSQLVQPGLCRIHNYDPTNFVTLEIYDRTTNRSYPIDEFLPGEFYTRRLSRYLLTDFISTGTGEDGSGVTLRLKADRAPCVVNVEAFES